MNKAILSGFMLLTALVVLPLQAQSNQVVQRSPEVLEMHVFRAPYSLHELLHDGLVGVQEKVQDLIAGALVSEGLQEIHAKLDGLNQQFNLMIDKSNMHAIHRGDRDYLQSMIDRIDAMIQTIEGSRTLSQSAQEMVQANLEQLGELKAKLDS